MVALISTNIFPQSENNIVKQSLDAYGSPIKNTLHQSESPYALNKAMTAYTYDTVRALTEINVPDSADAYPWISADGLRLYYTYGSIDSTRLMFTHRTDGNSYFVAPTRIQIAISNPLSCWLSQDELDMYVLDQYYQLYYLHRSDVSSPFNAPVPIFLQGSGYYENYGVSLNAAQNQLYTFAWYVGIMEYSRDSPTIFSYVRTLPLPSGYLGQVSSLSKDDLTLFFSATYYYGGQTLLYQMTRTAPTASFDTSTFQQIQGINDTSVMNMMPSMSDSLNWVAFVRNAVDYFYANDLFLAHNGILTSVFNPSEIQLYSAAYPNPASEIINIDYKTSSNSPLTVSIFSSIGILIYERTINNFIGKIKIDTREMKNGFYFYTLSQSKNKRTALGTGKFIVSH